jgi:ABC-type transport system involved in cytochrome c biogenesis permease component
MKLGVLEFMQNQNISIEKYIASIILSYTVVIILPPVIIGALLLIFSGLDPLMAVIVTGVTLLCSVVAVSLITMAAGFCSDVDNRGSLVGFLAFPMVVPAFLMADAFFSQFVKGFYNGAYVLFLFGLLLVSFGISIITSAFGIRLALK